MLSNYIVSKIKRKNYKTAAKIDATNIISNKAINSTKAPDINPIKAKIFESSFKPKIPKTTPPIANNNPISGNSQTNNNDKRPNIKESKLIVPMLPKLNFLRFFCKKLNKPNFLTFLILFKAEPLAIIGLMPTNPKVISVA